MSKLSDTITKLILSIAMSAMLSGCVVYHDNYRESNKDVVDLQVDPQLLEPPQPMSTIGDYLSNRVRLKQK